MERECTDFPPEFEVMDFAHDRISVELPMLSYANAELGTVMKAIGIAK